MRIVDHDKFNRRVKLPAIAVLFLTSLSLALTNIYLFGQPITLFVAMIPVFIGAGIMDTINKEDTHV